MPKLTNFLHSKFENNILFLLKPSSIKLYVLIFTTLEHKTIIILELQIKLLLS